ncbi:MULTISPECIES: M4 family metallopeptidase [unclassified Nocardioides]|uniref:M4 family metallopeptidase n=1 Tax=unclassified Nocardioides TaxID=2615069 RepID=UPI003014841A
MRRSWGTATLAALAIGTLGMTGGGGAASAAPSATEKGIGAAAVSALLAHPAAAQATDGTAFAVTDTVTDADGATHVRLDRSYHGLRVVGGDLVVHRGAAGTWRGVSRTLDDALTLTTAPAVAATAAASRTLAPAKATADIAGLRTEGKPELVVDALGAEPRLAWEVTTHGTQADGTPSELATYVDARTGKVIRRVEGIHTADGSGQSLYSGTVPIQVTQSGSSYTLTDATRGNAKTTDMQNKEDSILCQIFGAGCTNGVAYTSTDTSFGTGSNANRESAAVDAHYGGAKTFDYFKLVHGRNGIFGNGTGAPSRVHYGNGYVNAFWDGSKMTYGDGDGTEFGPLVSLDVAGHEMSHGVTENTANLTYSGESGGLNEATSDIFGTMVEFYAANGNDPGDYLIGEEFDLASHSGFRRMDNPIADGSSPNCYSSNTKNLDVHYSSGVGNHFFYLLAEGSGAKTIGGTAHNSPTCNGSTVAGIGRDAAAKIWFRALTVYMTSGTTYAQARTATLSAASDLYGASSTQRAAVAAAWSAVSVG